MKKTFFALFLIVLAGLVLAQSAAQIGDIKGRKNKPIRTAFEGIATQTKTVSANWTFSGNCTFSDSTDFDEIKADSIKLGTGLHVTSIDTFGTGGKWVKITVAGVTFWAIADTSVIP